MKNILVITGSPRQNGNSEMLADAFIEGAREGGHTVWKFEAGKKEVKGCIACDKCWSTGNACVFRDGFTELEPMLESADAVVIATPVYWSSFPAQLKAVLDKLYAYVSAQTIRPISIRQSALLVCAEGEGEAAFASTIAMYEDIGTYLKWENVAVIALPEVHKIGDIRGTDGLERARNLGSVI